MEKRVLSFRASDAVITALEAFQKPEDSSLSQTALRLLRSLLGVQPDTTVNAVNTDRVKDRVENLEGRLNEAIVSRDHLSDFVNDIVDKRIQHLIDALSDHENRLLSIEQPQEKQSPTSVTVEVTTQDITSALPQEETESAIALGDITNRKYFICPQCNNEGYEDVNFTKEGYTKAGTQRWKCGKCKNIRSETSIIKTK